MKNIYIEMLEYLGFKSSSEKNVFTYQNKITVSETKDNRFEINKTLTVSDFSGVLCHLVGYTDSDNLKIHVRGYLICINKDTMDFSFQEMGKYYSNAEFKKNYVHNSIKAVLNAFEEEIKNKTLNEQSEQSKVVAGDQQLSCKQQITSV